MAEYKSWFSNGWIEPRPWIKETVGSWASFLQGDGLTYSALPSWEAVKGERYSVGGTVVPQYVKAWLGQVPNYATPIHLLDLMNFLNSFTEDLEREAGRVMKKHDVTTCDELEAVAPGEGSTCRDLRRWRVRLDQYSMAVGAVPDADRYDRSKTLWDVTAPLLMGWYGGKTGTEIPLSAGGFPPGFDPLLRHAPDIGTPYSIANQLGIALAWEKERKDLILSELLDPGPGSIGAKFKEFETTAIVVGILGAVGLAWWILGTPKALKE